MGYCEQLSWVESSRVIEPEVFGTLKPALKCLRGKNDSTHMVMNMTSSGCTTLYIKSLKIKYDMAADDVKTDILW